MGISTGIKRLPTALTMQGNVHDKTNAREMLGMCTKILDKGSLLMFGCGANTTKVKNIVVEKGLHYLALKPKKVGMHGNLIKGFDNECGKFDCNGVEYLYTKKPSKYLANSCTSISRRSSVRTSCTKEIQSSSWNKITFEAYVYACMDNE